MRRYNPEMSAKTILPAILTVLLLPIVLAPLPVKAQEAEPPGLLLLYEMNRTRAQHLVKVLEKPAAAAGFKVTAVTKVYGRTGALKEFMDKEHARLKFDKDRIVLLGFSAAGKDALKFTVKYHEKLAGTIVAAAADFEITRNDTKGIGRDYPFLLFYSRKDPNADYKVGRDARKVLKKSKLDATFIADEVLNHFDIMQKGHQTFLPWAAENSYYWKHLKLAKAALKDDKRARAMEHWALFKKKYKRSELNEKFKELLPPIEGE
jgi:predicted esterase